MNCPQCGTENQEGATFCKNCGVPLQQAAGGPAAPGQVPPEISGFNFGAFALNWIWAFAHRLWGWGIGILVGSCLPIVSLGLAIYLGVKGNELAWKAKHFDSVQQFKDTQKAWTIAGIVVFCISIVMIPIIGIMAAVAIPNFIVARDRAMYTSCLESLSSVKIAQEMFITDNGIYADDVEKLDMYVIAECSDPAGCGGQLKARVLTHCSDFSMELTDMGYNYYITGTAMDSRSCGICMTPAGFTPENYSDCSDGMPAEQRCNSLP